MDLATSGAGAALLVAAGVLVLVGGLLGGLLGSRLGRRRRLEVELEAARAELDALRHRVEELGAAPPVAATAERPVEFVITDLDPTRSEPPLPAPVSGTGFVSVVVGESLVKAVALGHGVRRALSADNRDRMTLAMRRHTRLSRRDRRRELKAARRRLRTEVPAGAREDAA